MSVRSIRSFSFEATLLLTLSPRKRRIDRVISISSGWPITFRSFSSVPHRSHDIQRERTGLLSFSFSCFNAISLTFTSIEKRIEQFFFSPYKCGGKKWKFSRELTEITIGVTSAGVKRRVLIGYDSRVSWDCGNWKNGEVRGQLWAMYDDCSKFLNQQGNFLKWE